MRGFERTTEGALEAELLAEELGVLSSMNSQLIRLLSTGAAPDDPAMQRLLPDAYPDDAGESAEFRRYTEAGLLARKLENAATMAQTLEVAAGGASRRGAARLRLDPEQTQAWLRALTDIRLVLATRLGITAEDERPAPDDAAAAMYDVYDWLGFVQESLVQALG